MNSLNVLLGLFASFLLISFQAHGSVPVSVDPMEDEPAIEDAMSEEEIQAAVDEWEMIFDELDATSDQVASRRKNFRVRATRCGVVQASWYGKELHGHPTANGERFNRNGLTAAHRTLPFGKRVRVTSVKTGRSVTVRINDRGPYHGNRKIDLSERAAKAIGLGGTGQVRMDCN